MGDQPAALLGQLCIKIGQCTCTVDDNCFILFNTGQEIIDSDNGLLSTVAYKLGTKQKSYYALEGAIPNAGASINWLKEKLQISTDIQQNTINSINSADILNNYVDDITSSSLNSSGSSTKLKINSNIGINTSNHSNNCLNTSTSNNNNNNSNGNLDNLPGRRGDVLFIPAFNGLYSPYWKHDARG